MSNFSKNLVAVILSIGFSFLIFECGTRIYALMAIDYDIEMWKYRRELAISLMDPRGHIQKSNKSVKLMGVDVLTNSFGCRDKEYRRERVLGVKRLAVIGDSFTFGWGVEDKYRFSELLEDELNKKDRVEVINFAQVNYNTEQQLALIDATVRDFNPDLYLVAFYINDAEVAQLANENIFEKTFVSPTLIMNRLRRILSQLNSSSHFEEYYLELYNGQAWDSYVATLNEMYREIGKKMVVVLLPELRATKGDAVENIYLKVENYWKSKGVLVLNLHKPFKGILQDLWVADDDPHPNRKANRLFSKEILEFFEKNGVLNWQEKY